MAFAVPTADFKKLTRILIALYYDDYIKVGSDNIGEDKWVAELAMAQQFVDTNNRYVGKVDSSTCPNAASAVTCNS